MYKPFKNLKNLWEESRIRQLKKEVEKTAGELTNGVSPPYSDFTLGTLHVFNEARSESKGLNIIFE